MIYKYNESKIKGVYELFVNTFKDERGTISKTFEKESFLELNLECDFAQTLITTNYNVGVIRGFHFQKPPYAQAKTLYAVSGKFLNLVLDLRKSSNTYGAIDTFLIDNNKNNLIFVPKGVANCYCILEKNTTIAYNITSKYDPQSEGGVLYSSVGFSFPIEAPIVSDKDLKLPPLSEFDSPFYT